MPDTKITALTAIGANPIIPSTFPIPMVDLTDTSMAASGTTKKVTVNQILGAGGTATLASATITGDLTVRTNKLAVTSTGVGIGTASPTVPLYVTGNNATATAIMQDETNGAKLRLLANSINFDISNGGGGGDIAVSGANPFTFRTNGSERYRIASDGVATWSNVGGVAGTAMTLNSTGLGVGVASPSYNLDVRGASSPTIQVRNTTSGIGNFAQLRLDVNNSFSGSGTAYLRAISGNSGNSNVDLAFGVNAVGGGAPFEAMRIDSSGNVGIGVTPSAWVSTFKAINVSSYAAFGGNSDDKLTLVGNNYYNDGTAKFIGNGYAGAYSIYQGAHRFQISTTNNSSGAGAALTFTQAMTLDASGRLILLASTTTPATLSTNGQLTFTATSNTNLRFSYRGSDGVTRTADLTLA